MEYEEMLRLAEEEGERENHALLKNMAKALSVSLKISEKDSAEDGYSNVYITNCLFDAVIAFLANVAKMAEDSSMEADAEHVMHQALSELGGRLLLAVHHVNDLLKTAPSL